MLFEGDWIDFHCESSRLGTQDEGCGCSHAWNSGCPSLSVTPQLTIGLAVTMETAALLVIDSRMQKELAIRHAIVEIYT